MSVQIFKMGNIVVNVRLQDGPTVERMNGIIAYLEKEMATLSSFQIGVITHLVNDWAHVTK